MMNEEVWQDYRLQCPWYWHADCFATRQPCTYQECAPAFWADLATLPLERRLNDLQNKE